MEIKAFELGQLGTNAYLLLPDNSEETVLIDAPFDAAREITAALKASNRKLAAILLTQCHWDHVWDAAKLAELCSAKVYAAKDGAILLEEKDFQSKNLYSPSGMDAAKIDVYPKDGDVLNIAGLKIRCLEAPGHCPGSIVYFVEDGDSKYLFAGDVIFEESVGRADLWGGDFSKLQKSISEKVYTLAPDTVIFPGHGPATSVGHEMKNNPYVRK